MTGGLDEGVAAARQVVGGVERQGGSLPGLRGDVGGQAGEVAVDGVAVAGVEHAAHQSDAEGVVRVDPVRMTLVDAGPAPAVAAA